MRLFILPEDFDGGDYLDVSGEDFHHLCRVRRLGEGDSLPAADRGGRSYHVTIEKISRGSCRLRVQRKGENPSDFPAITLYQCLPKGSKFDTIVRQAAETGLRRVVPVESRYSVPRPAGDRTERWRRVAREAAQQSGAVRVPEIGVLLSLRDIPADWRGDSDLALGIFFHQAPLETTSLHEYLSLRRERIAIVVGPEGGLADDEIAHLRSGGFVPAYLGPTVLRTETAPVFAAAAVRIIVMEKEKWKLAR
jgi:16S rRNA (uracil1498-N3)-methyltransferase